MVTNSGHINGVFFQGRLSQIRNNKLLVYPHQELEKYHHLTLQVKNNGGPRRKVDYSLGTVFILMVGTFQGRLGKMSKEEVMGHLHEGMVLTNLLSLNKVNV